MEKLECPYCHQPLNFVVVTVTEAYQQWEITDEGGMACSNTDVMVNSEPRCWKCDGLVGAFLQEHGIPFEWNEESEVNECRISTGG
jgi:hypothetical protein